MFIYTIGDILVFAVWAIVILFWIGVLSYVKLQRWREHRRKGAGHE
ncbi:hypothetical protein [Hydrogenophaga sp.]